MRSIKRAKRTLLGVAGLLLTAAIGLSATYAWTHHEVEQPNNFHSHTTSVTIDEKTDGDLNVWLGAEEKKEVKFTNTGTSAVFLRVAWAETWTKPANPHVPTPEVILPSDNTNVVKTWTSSWQNDWEEGPDGWYYYKLVLPQGGSTADVLSKVNFAYPLPYDYSVSKYDLYFVAEVVQLSDEAVVNTAATQLVFGRTATLSNTTQSNGAITSGTVTWS